MSQLKKSEGLIIFAYGDESVGIPTVEYAISGQFEMHSHDWSEFLLHLAFAFEVATGEPVQIKTIEQIRKEEEQLEN